MDFQTLPRKVQICEVAPRDGFQNEHEWIPTEQKINIVRELANAGIQYIEITSFVHPKAIPQLKDAEVVVRRTADLKNIKFRALVPNVKGAQRAIDAGIKKMKLMLSATDSHSLANANCLVEEAIKGIEPIIQLAEKHKVEVGGSISVAFGCPYEGIVPVERLLTIIESYEKLGIKEVSLADTTGMANPKQVYEYLGVLKDAYPNMKYSMHFHNTRGMAFANVIASLLQNVTHFDSSVAGLGGCPYAPGATGNIATEDLVHSLHEMGIETGIHLDKIIEVASNIKKKLGHDGGSYMLKAGPNSKLSIRPKEQKKLED